MSPTLFKQLETYVDFKADFHNVSICAWKDLEHTWNLLSYLEFEMDVEEVVGYWPVEWLEPTTLDF